MKELRLRAIDTIDAANAPEFMADFNLRFGKEPCNPKDMHRRLPSTRTSMARCAARKSARCRKP
ncbi:hypothetical protein ACVJBD_007645 [Rhizobium mongolense]